MESKQKCKETEKLFLTVNQADLAINMYKKLKQHDEMIRFVEKFHADLLQQTHVHLAQLSEKERKFSIAEHHYVAGREYKSAIRMYVIQKMWEDAHRVAKNSQDLGMLNGRPAGVFLKKILVSIHVRLFLLFL